MIKSMTGYGRESYADEELSFDIEIKSVNSRYLDLSIKMPNQFNFLEETLRKTVKNYVDRGRVDVFIRSTRKNFLKSKVSIDVDAAMEMKNGLQLIIDKTGIEDKVLLSHILKNEDVLSYEAPDLEDEYLEKVIVDSLSSALNALDLMRIKEGKNLEIVLSSYIDQLEENLGQIANLSKDLTSEYRDKLFESIAKLLDGKHPLDEDKLANEIVFYADRADIQEEINRMKSHISQFRQGLLENSSIGKRLDFITQEMLRETNTIGSKSNKEEITKLVIEQKTLIEKVKEQVQNIE